MRFVADHRVLWATRLFKGVTWLGSNAVLIPLVVVLGGYVLLRRRNLWAAALLVVALAGANAWYHVVKLLVARDRPPEAFHLIGVSGFAFPQDMPRPRSRSGGRGDRSRPVNQPG
jgi:undecaprenyl-diphosphatase